MDSVEALLETARGQPPAAAVVTLEKALALWPHHEEVATLLGVNYFHLKRWAEAVRFLNRDGAGKTLAARARIALAEEFDPPDRQFLEEAYRLLQEALAANPADGPAWLAMARIHWLLQDADRALECVGKSVSADGRLDFEDFEALMFGCLVLVETRRFSGLKAALERLEGLSQEGQHRRQIAASIGKLCSALARSREFAVALELVPCFERIAPGEPELRQLARLVRRLAALQEDKSRLPSHEKLAHQVLDLQVRLDLAALGGEDRPASEELVNLAHELPREKLEGLGRLLRGCKSLGEAEHPFFKQLLAPRPPLGPPPRLESVVASPSFEGLGLADLRRAVQDGLPGAPAALLALVQSELATSSDWPALDEMCAALCQALAVAQDTAPFADGLYQLWRTGMSRLQADPQVAALSVVDRLNAGALAGQLAGSGVADDSLWAAAELFHLRGARPATWKHGRAGLAQWVEKLASPATCEAAAEELARVGPAELAELSRPLAALLGSPQAEVRLAAGRVLASLRRYAAPARPALIQALGDEAEEVRQAARRALEAMGPAGAVQALKVP